MTLRLYEWPEANDFEVYPTPMNDDKLKSLDMSTITVCKNYALLALQKRKVSTDIIDDVLDGLARLSARVKETQAGLPPGTYKPHLRVRSKATAGKIWMTPSRTPSERRLRLVRFDGFDEHVSAIGTSTLIRPATLR